MDGSGEIDDGGHELNAYVAVFGELVCTEETVVLGVVAGVIGDALWLQNPLTELVEEVGGYLDRKSVV